MSALSSHRDQPRSTHRSRSAGTLERVVDLIIRKAVLMDEADLAGVTYRAWSPVSDITPRPDRDAGFFGQWSRPEDYLVAIHGHRLVGYLRLEQPIPVPSAAHVRQVRGLAVDEGVRGRGIGSALMEAAFAESRAQGASRITLRVLAPNTDARRLYKRMGFVEEGILRGEFIIDGSPVDDVLLARSL